MAQFHTNCPYEHTAIFRSWPDTKGQTRYLKICCCNTVPIPQWDAHFGIFRPPKGLRGSSYHLLAPTGPPPAVRSSDVYISPWL